MPLYAGIELANGTKKMSETTVKVLQDFSMSHAKNYMDGFCMLRAKLQRCSEQFLRAFA
jgi:hypothetical protein